MKITACTHRRRDEHHEARHRPRDDELRADDPGQIADDRLRQPADADDPARQRVLRQPGQRSRQQSRRRAGGQRDVDHDDEHEVERGRPADDQLRHGRLEHQGQAQRPRSRTARSSLRRLDGPGFGASACGPGAWGVSTTSTSSRLEKSTAGRMVDGAVGAAAPLHPLDPADHEALRVDAVDPGGHDGVADGELGRPVHVLQPQPVLAVRRSPRPGPSSVR